MDQDANPHSAGDEAITFLELLRPNGPWTLTAIVPDGAIETITAQSTDAVAAFVAKYNGERNLYYSVNPTRTLILKKASKTDIGIIEYLPADLDPKEGETPEAAKARYLAALEGFEPKPAAVIDSGNGLNILLKLSERIELPTPVIIKNSKTGAKKQGYPKEAAALIAEVESRAKALMEKLGSVAGTQNIDRILRLPGTINLPNAKKRKAGRVACTAKLISFNGATCSLGDLPKLSPESTPKTKTIETDASIALNWAEVYRHAGWLKGIKNLPPKFNRKGRAIIGHKGTLEDLKVRLAAAGMAAAKPYESWSEVSFALAAIFKNDGRFTNEEIAAALMCDLDCNYHITKQSDNQATQERAVERLVSRAGQRPAGEPNWRERNKYGYPLPSMHNARLAISAVGVACSCDTFHNEMLFGYKNDATRHVVQHFLGEVSDDGLLALRLLLSDRFGVDFTDTHTRDAVKSLALEHCFDPVADMLDAAQAGWDRVARLDRMAADHLNCEDTPLNAACIRKTMIAAVRRVRQPGCKFDTIPVLESDEGWNKSTAIETLAGKENFSDERIIGKDSREVQEQLAGVWFHENADLAGMKKAEVEAVKAYCSRTVDRARPAYGHFLKRQKRRSIDWGTTNNDAYLQSQTGNRRFWPLKMLKAIDLEKLRADRLQLWGEAAHFESEGESLTLAEAMWGAAGIEQEARRVRDPWESALARLPDLEGTDVDDLTIIHRVGDQDYVATTDLFERVLNIPVKDQTRAHEMRLADVMRMLGWQRAESRRVTIKGKRVQGYFRLRPT